jgi:hypothetical protein
MEVAVGFAGLAGLRRSEIAMVRWSDLNVATKRLRLDGGDGKSPRQDT